MIFLNILTSLILSLNIKDIYGFSDSIAKQIHLFGHENEDLITSSTVSISMPSYHRYKRSIDDKQKMILPIRIKDEIIKFELFSKHEIIKRLSSTVDECLYQGQSISPNNSFSIALTGCHHDTQGIILTNTDDYYVIRPMNFLNYSNILKMSNNNSYSGSHFIQKRSANWQRHSKCGYHHDDDPYPEDLIEQQNLYKSDFLPVQKYKDLKIELGLFVDDAMWNFFSKFYGKNVEKQLRKFVLTVVNNIDILFTHSSIEPKVHLRITHFEVLKTPPVGMTRIHHNSGDVTKLLEGFCSYQSSINTHNDQDPIHWDHALLLTGYDLYRGKEETIAGFAPVKGMCVDLKSCTVNEGLDFGAVFVIAHEMGHSLGMYHDGEANSCLSRCCIMSPSIGAGKTQWSDCSTKELRFFISKLGTDTRAINCLADDDDINVIPRFRHAFPGQLYSLDEQCSLFHGSCWKHELKFGQLLKDVCEMVWCTNGRGIIRNTHPALEGTYCGPNSVCMEGICVLAQNYGISMNKTNGQWSEWSSTGNCVDECNNCQIKGQIRVRSSIRLCNNPFKNNGGIECEGSNVRGLVCSPPNCSNNVTIDEYASKLCQKHAKDPINFDLNLSGKGFQFEQNPCKVWCQMGNSRDIRTMDEFPNGTPCGTNRYCINGECHKLFCNNTVLVHKDEDCPRIVGENIDEESTFIDIDRKRGPEFNQTLINLSYWTEWGSWSNCNASECNQNGTKQRIRSCLYSDTKNESQLCTGSRRQRTACVKIC